MSQIYFLQLVAMEKGVVYESVAVHDFAEYIQGCMNVLDEEWSRSASSRSVIVNETSRLQCQGRT